MAHIFQLRFHGMAPPITEGAKKNAKKLFFPTLGHHRCRSRPWHAGTADTSWANRAPLEFPADPTSSSYIPRPEWTFFYFQLLKYFPGALEPIVTVAIPLFIFGSMVLLPFIDTSEERRPWRKPVTTLAASSDIVVIVLFTILGMAGPA